MVLSTKIILQKFCIQWNDFSPSWKSGDRKILRWIKMITIAYFQCNFPLNEEYAEEK